MDHGTGPRWLHVFAAALPVFALRLFARDWWGICLATSNCIAGWACITHAEPHTEKQSWMLSLLICHITSPSVFSLVVLEDSLCRRPPCQTSADVCSQAGDPAAVHPAEHAVLNHVWTARSTRRGGSDDAHRVPSVAPCQHPSRCTRHPTKSRLEWDCGTILLLSMPAAPGSNSVSRLWGCSSSCRCA